jgi:hypothetical protein
MFPKKGNSFPGGNDRENDRQNYSGMVATALRSELGNSHRATKTVMRWTGASERTVKHWFTARHGPGGRYLIVLMRESDAVFEAILTAAGRRDAFVAARVLAAHGSMVEVIGLVKREGLVSPETGAMGTDRAAGSVGIDANDRKNDRNDDRNDDRNPVSAGRPPERDLSPRQRWYLEGLAAGEEMRAADLRRRWGVSDKTARRDVAALKERGMIEFVGPSRTGRYRLLR